MDNLSKAGRHREADALLPGTRTSGSGCSTWGTRWTTSACDGWRGAWLRAWASTTSPPTPDGVRQTFLDAKNPFEAALATLDLVVSHLEEGNTAEIRVLADEALKDPIGRYGLLSQRNSASGMRSSALESNLMDWNWNRARWIPVRLRKNDNDRTRFEIDRTQTRAKSTETQNDRTRIQSSGVELKSSPLEVKSSGLDHESSALGSNRME